MKKKQSLQEEIDYRIRSGQTRITLQKMEEILGGLGYKLLRPMSCFYMAKWMTGERAGASHPAISTGIVEIDTGLSFANPGARRDANFETLQKMRTEPEYFVIIRGRILDL